MASAADILNALRTKDYTTANKAFTAVMQQKVNACLMAEKKTIVTEDRRTYWDPTKQGDAHRAAMDAMDEKEADKKDDKKQVYNNLAASVKKLAKEASESFTVQCQECGKSFKTKSMVPECPKCGSSDIDLPRTIKEDAYTDAGWKKCARCGVTFHPLHTSTSNSESDKYCDECAGFRKDYPQHVKEDGFTKKALIRDPNVPVGKPAAMYLTCVCGHKVDMGTSDDPAHGNVCSECGREYDSRGYLYEATVNCPDCKKPLIGGHMPCKNCGSTKGMGPAPRAECNDEMMKEGRTVRIRYQVQIYSSGHNYTPAAWDVRFPYGPVKSGEFAGKTGLGKPTDANLAQYVKDFESGTAKGGPNEHLGPVKVTRAEIKDNNTGDIVARYRA